MSNIDSMGHMLLAGVPIVEIDGEWFIAAYDHHSAQVLFDAETSVRAFRALEKASGFSPFDKYRGIEEVLLISDLYDIEQCARLILDGYTGAELREAHEHGIDIDLYTSLRNGR